MSNPSLNMRFCCPIHLGLMTEPCTTPCGHTFDKVSLQQLMAQPYHGYGQMRGPWGCPTCRAPIPPSWYPVVNYDLKGIIDDAVTAFQGTGSSSSSGSSAPAQVPVQVVEAQIPPTVTAKFANGDKIHLQVSVPADAKPLPLNVIAVIDMSGSMGGRATEPKPVVAGQATEESSLMSRMDLTGHSVKALAKTLKATDCLSVIGFDNEAVTYLPPTAMDAAGQGLAVSKVAQIKPRGGTSFWAGISAALKTLEASAAVNPGANNVIIFQTDGESDPSYDPPQGLIKSLEAWKDRHADIKFSLHTVGYGYGDALQSDLLLSVAKKCGGDFYYVPDGSVLAQVAIHLFANLGAITHTDVSLRLDGYDRAFLPVGFLQAGQKRDFILDGQATAVARLFVKNAEVGATSVSEGAGGESADALAHDIFERGLSTGLATGRLDDAGIKAALTALPSSDYITALLTDLDHADKYKGQISKGFLPENFKKWGKHYLPGVLSGHRNKWPMNFKDECSVFYETPVTKAAIELGVDIYEALGAIKATYTVSDSANGGYRGAAAAPMYVAPSAHARGCTCAMCTGGGGCFTGDTMVRLLVGFKRMDELRAGDVLQDPSNDEKGNTIKCVVRYDVDKPQLIVRIGDAGLTEFHPILINDTTGDLTQKVKIIDINVWEHPGHLVRAMPEALSAVYNVILESGHMIMLRQNEKEVVIACTLAHTFTGHIISHSYFGKPVAGMPHVLEDLMKAPTWDKGYIVCKNTREERDSVGEIIRLICEYA